MRCVTEFCTSQSFGQKFRREGIFLASQADEYMRVVNHLTAIFGYDGGIREHALRCGTQRQIGRLRRLCDSIPAGFDLIPDGVLYMSR